MPESEGEGIGGDIVVRAVVVNQSVGEGHLALSRKGCVVEIQSVGGRRYRGLIRLVTRGGFQHRLSHRRTYQSDLVGRVERNLERVHVVHNEGVPVGDQIAVAHQVGVRLHGVVAPREDHIRRQDLSGIVRVAGPENADGEGHLVPGVAVDAAGAGHGGGDGIERDGVVAGEIARRGRFAGPGVAPRNLQKQVRRVGGRGRGPLVEVGVERQGVRPVRLAGGGGERREQAALRSGVVHDVSGALSRSGVAVYQGEVHRISVADVHPVGEGVPGSEHIAGGRILVLHGLHLGDIESDFRGGAGELHGAADVLVGVLGEGSGPVHNEIGLRLREGVGSGSGAELRAHGKFLQVFLRGGGVARSGREGDEGAGVRHGIDIALRGSRREKCRADCFFEGQTQRHLAACRIHCQTVRAVAVCGFVGKACETGGGIDVLRGGGLGVFAVEIELEAGNLVLVIVFAAVFALGSGQLHIAGRETESENPLPGRERIRLLPAGREREE